MQQFSTSAAQLPAQWLKSIRAAPSAPEVWLASDVLLCNLRTLAGINFDFCLWYLAGAGRVIFDETGLIENLQAALLAVAFIVLLRTALANTGAARTAAIGFAFVCFSVFFREVDLRTLDSPDLVITLTTGNIRNRLFYASAALLGVYLLRRRSYIKPIFAHLLSRESRPLQVAIAMVIAAAILEDVFYHTRLNKFWEEGIETLAYGLVLHAAMARYWMPAQPGSQPAAALRKKSPISSVKSRTATPYSGSLRLARRFLSLW